MAEKEESEIKTVKDVESEIKTVKDIDKKDEVNYEKMYNELLNSHNKLKEDYNKSLESINELQQKKTELLQANNDLYQRLTSTPTEKVSIVDELIKLF